MSQPSGRADAIVVGAGHNGLTAAAYLARAGLDVIVLERRDIVGGACVTEEIAPGCRCSTTSYIASMLRPEIIRDLDLARHGLRMVACEPALQVPFLDGEILPWWSDTNRTAEEIKRFSPADADTFVELDERLKELAAYLQPFFLEPPPDLHARGVRGAGELFKVGRRMRGVGGRDIGDLTSFFTGSLGRFLDRNFESDHVKTLMLANNVYGKHGGPYEEGSSVGLLFHLLSGGEDEIQGFFGHVMGGMGAITQALAEAARGFGARIVTGAEVARIDVVGEKTSGVTLADGTEFLAPLVLSNADPKRTFLGLVEPGNLPDDFTKGVEGIRMDGPSAKVNLVLDAEPQVTAMPADADPLRRSLFTLVESLEEAERCYDDSKYGVLSDRLWVDCVVASNVDPGLAPEGKHILSCFVQYVPYELRDSDWDTERERLGDLVIERIARYAPNVPDAVIARHVLTPRDLERTYGLTEGNIFHGDLSTEQLFFMRPLPGWSQYATPVEGLYMCGAGVHPGGGVTGAPGYCAAHEVLRRRKERTWRRVGRN